MALKFCAKCRRLFSKDQEKRSVIFQGQFFHQECLIQHILFIVGNAFNYNADVITRIRQVKNDWISFEQLLLWIWTSQPDVLTMDKSFRSLLLDLLVEVFNYDREALNPSVQDNTVVLLVQGGHA